MKILMEKPKSSQFYITNKIIIIIIIIIFEALSITIKGVNVGQNHQTRRHRKPNGYAHF